MGKKELKKSKNQKTKEYQAPKKATAKVSLLAIAIVLIGVLGIGFFAMRGDKTGYVNAKDAAYKKTSSVEIGQIASNSIISNETNIENLKGGETKSVLSPARFTGKTASAYKVAQENPELLDSMYCYCYCKKTIGHKSLLSCFTDNHASKCTICQDQAFYAKIMQDKGLDIGQVRKEVDRKFWRPFS